MKDLLNWIDASYTAGLIILLIFAVVMVFAWLLYRKGVKNAYEANEETELSNSIDTEMMRRALRRKREKLEHKDYNDEDVDMNFTNGLN